MKLLTFTVFFNPKFGIDKTLSSQGDEIKRKILGPLFEMFDVTNKDNLQTPSFVPFSHFVFETQNFTITKAEAIIILIEFSNWNHGVIFNKVNFCELVDVSEKNSQKKKLIKRE